MQLEKLKFNDGVRVFSDKKLNYSYNALEPYIDAQTMEIHYTKHHQAYIDNLNKAIKGNIDLESKSIEDLISHLTEVPKYIRNIVCNNEGGHSNRSLFWTVIGPKSDVVPAGEFASDIKKSFGSFDGFKEKFTQAATTRFGSGWACLSLTKDGNLEISSTAKYEN